MVKAGSTKVTLTQGKKEIPILPWEHSKGLCVPKTSLTVQQQSNGWMEGRGGIITSVLLELHAKREACKETSKTV